MSVSKQAGCSEVFYCQAAPNSVSPSGAHIGYQGTPSVQANDFSLTLDSGPPGQFSFFFYGPYEASIPLAIGNLCVSSDGTGFRRLHPADQIDASGMVLRQVDFTNLTGHNIIQAGTRWNFQCWYRDQVGGSNTSRFSDALGVTFCE